MRSSSLSLCSHLPGWHRFFPALPILSTCSISCRRTNQKFAILSFWGDMPITGESLSSQKHTPSILAFGSFSTIMKRTPHSFRIVGMLLVCSGANNCSGNVSKIAKRLFAILRSRNIHGDLSHSEQPSQLSRTNFTLLVAALSAACGIYGISSGIVTWKKRTIESPTSQHRSLNPSTLYHFPYRICVLHVLFALRH